MRLTIVIAVIIALTGLGIYLSRLASQSPDRGESVPNPLASTLHEDVSFQAAFLVFTNGTKRDFSAPRYHNLNSSAYLTADNPNLIQVRSRGITWQNFFDTLPMQLSEDCIVTGTKQKICTGNDGNLKFYLNGTQEHRALSQVIMAGDQLLVTFGSESEVDIASQLVQLAGLIE